MIDNDFDECVSTTADVYFADNAHYNTLVGGEGTYVNYGTSNVVSEDWVCVGGTPAIVIEDD